MKILKVLIAAFLIFFICMTVCEAFSWFSLTSTSISPPTPVVKWPFDVSKRDSKVSQEFRIREYRSYYFALRFNYFGEVDLYRVLALVGDGSSKYPGIAIPIHIKIYKLNTEIISPELIYENTIVTKKRYAHGFERKQTDGNYTREIIAINLKSGIYRVEANTIKDSPEFSGTPTYLQIEGHSQIRFLPNGQVVK
ncbi:MAG: DUF5625 family protein [Deltaproteobacteria bacterium]|nr:DUF5625 family protein [Deltaproteobacteria bacterium]